MWTFVREGRLMLRFYKEICWFLKEIHECLKGNLVIFKEILWFDMEILWFKKPVAENCPLRAPSALILKVTPRSFFIQCNVCSENLSSGMIFIFFEPFSPSYSPAEFVWLGFSEIVHQLLNFLECRGYYHPTGARRFIDFRKKPNAECK